jgi:hypothetical protein
MFCVHKNFTVSYSTPEQSAEENIRIEERRSDGEWRKLQKENLHKLYPSPSIIRVIKSRKMRRAGHVARMGRRGMHIGYWWESQKERDTRETKT